VRGRLAEDEFIEEDQGVSGYADNGMDDWDRENRSESEDDDDEEGQSNSHSTHSAPKNEKVDSELLDYQMQRRRRGNRRGKSRRRS